jgi:hypothetical protein
MPCIKGIISFGAGYFYLFKPHRQGHIHYLLLFFLALPSPDHPVIVYFQNKHTKPGSSRPPDCMKRPIVKHTLMLALFAMPMAVAAKPKRDTISTNQGVEVFIKNDKSKKLSLIAELHVVDAEASLADYARIGTGANIDYYFKKYLSLNAGFKGTYFSYLSTLASKTDYSENTITPFSVGGAGIRIHFWDGKGWEKRKMLLESFKEVDGKGMPRTTVRTLRAKFPCRRIMAVRGGAYFSTAPVTANHNASVTQPAGKGTVRTVNGTKFTGDYYTNSTTTGFYAGVTRVTHMKFKSTNTISWMEGAEKQTAIFKEVYADVIVANTTIDPFKVKGMEYPIEPNGKESFTVNNIGWRVGGRLVSTRKKINLGTSYEIGMRPGLKSRAAYLSIGINIAYVR